MLDADEPSPSPDPRSELLDLIWSGWKTQAIYVAAELRVADELGAGSLNAAELAGRVACQPASLERLMRSLASLGICEQHADRQYALTPLGDLLRSDTPTSLRSWACLWGQSLWDTWGGLLYSVRTGSSARARATGQVGYTHLIAGSGRASTFNSSMSELTRLVACRLAESIDLRGVRRVVDVGGGQGELLAAVLQRHEHVHGTVFDLAHALEGARERLRRMNLEARCQVLEGDFFESVPVGAQGYVLKSVLHNWADDKAGIILRNCHRAMSPDARLFVVERVLPDQVTHCAEHQAALRSDLNMLVGPGGRERDATAMSDLLECGGFEILRSWPLSFGFRAIEVRQQTAEIRK